MKLKGKTKLAVYKGTDSWSSEFISEIEFGPDSEYIRQSEFLEVEFVPRNQTDMINDEVKSLERQIDNIKSKALDNISELNTRKEELLALTQF